MGEDGVIRSILRAKDVLKCLSEGMDQLKDVADTLDLSKSTTHRLLKTLKVAGMVREDRKSRRYHIGPQLLSLAANPFVAHRNLIVCSYEEMVHLRNATGETVILHIMMGINRFCLEEVPSLHNLKYTAGVGSVAPIYVGSAGKMLLSEMGKEELEVILNNIEFRTIGPNTIKDKDNLLVELTKAKEQQYAESVGERVAGSASISVPIMNYVEPACISVLGPENRFGGKRMEVLETMKACAANISDRLASV